MTTAHTPDPDLILPSGAASEALLRIGLKPVVRELHDVKTVQQAVKRWSEMGYHCVQGESIREDASTAAMVVDIHVEHTIRHLADHPVIARVVEVGGRPARRLLLEPGPVHRYLCGHLGAERPEHIAPVPKADNIRERCALYVSTSTALAEQARAADRMAADDASEADALALGALLGYPPCCVKAFCALERRWPNRLPIAAAAARSRGFHPRLNNVALDRFAYIAWFPCRYDCEASIHIANEAATALAKEAPERVAAMDKLLSLPRIVLDDTHQALLLNAGQAGRNGVNFKGLMTLSDAWPGRRESTARPFDPFLNATSARGGPDGVAFFSEEGALGSLDDALLLPFGMTQ